VIALWVFMACC